MKTIFTSLFVTILAASMAGAIPRFAFTTGAKCGACHVNPTGCQLRTEYGTTYSVNTLAMATTYKKAETEGSVDSTSEPGVSEDNFEFNPRLTENITVGGDLRTQLIYDRGSKSSTFQAMTMMLYAGVQIHKKVTLYVKQDIVNSPYGYLSGPEAFGLVKPSSDWYFKAGIFYPDYGLRIDDHTAYTRGGDLGFIGSVGGYSRGLIFVPDYKDAGVEAGWTHGGLMLTGGLFNGSGNLKPIDFSKEKGYAAKGEYMGNATENLHYRAGVSTYGYANFHMSGVHAGIGSDDFAVYAEADWTRNTVDKFSGTVLTGVQCMAGFAELDYRVKQGIWLTGRYDTFDPQLGLENDPNGAPLNSVKRLAIGAELFPYSFVEVRPQYRLNIEDPSVDNDQVLVQFHFWY